MELFKHNSDGSEIIELLLGAVIVVLLAPLILIIGLFVAANLADDDNIKKGN